MGMCDGKVLTISLYKGISKMYSLFLDSEQIPMHHCSDVSISTHKFKCNVKSKTTEESVEFPGKQRKLNSLKL